MYHGGTSFGFMNGAYDQSGNRGSVPMVTSYDYDAPISDIGELTEKYWAIRRTIQKVRGEGFGFLLMVSISSCCSTRLTPHPFWRSMKAKCWKRFAGRAAKQKLRNLKKININLS